MSLGAPELLIILLIVLLLFGGTQLPRLARSMRGAQQEMKAARRETPTSNSASRRSHVCASARRTTN